MTNHPNRSKIVNLSIIKPSAQLQQDIDIEVTREAREAADYKSFRELLLEPQEHAAILGLGGQRFHIAAMRVMLDDELRIKPLFKKMVIEDAVKQVVRKLYPERKRVQVDISLAGCKEEEGYYEYEASVWWEYRRQYEQLFCSVRY